MNKKGFINIVIAVVIAAAIAGGAYYFVTQKNAQSKELTRDDVLNAYYADSRFVNGTYPNKTIAEFQEICNTEGAIEQYRINDVVVGDLNGDGQSEAVAIVNEHSACGTGSGVYIFLFENRNSDAYYLDRAYLAPKDGSNQLNDSSISIDANKNVVVVSRESNKFDESKNTFEVTRTYQMVGGKLKEILNQNSISLDWKTYTNTTYGYQISYPADFVISENGAVKFNFPPSSFPNTTFVEGSLTIDPIMAENCYGQNNIYDFKKAENESVIINGISFHKNSGSHSIRGGQYGEGEIYTTLNNGNCYYIDLSVITRNKSPEDTVIVFNTEEAFVILRKILNTFKFIPATTIISTEKLTAEAILNLSNEDLVSGGARWSGYHLTVDKNRIIFGDLDGDGVNEAIAPVSYCSVSCGVSVYVFKLYQGKIILAEITETSAKAIDSMQISNSLVAVTRTDSSGTLSNSYQIQFINGQFVITSKS